MSAKTLTIPKIEILVISYVVLQIITLVNLVHLDSVHSQWPLSLVCFQ